MMNRNNRMYNDSNDTRTIDNSNIINTAMPVVMTARRRRLVRTNAKRFGHATKEKDLIDRIHDARIASLSVSRRTLKRENISDISMDSDLLSYEENEPTITTTNYSEVETSKTSSSNNDDDDDTDDTVETSYESDEECETFHEMMNMLDGYSEVGNYVKRSKEKLCNARFRIGENDVRMIRSRDGRFRKDQQDFVSAMPPRLCKRQSSQSVTSNQSSYLQLNNELSESLLDHPPIMPQQYDTCQLTTKHDNSDPIFSPKVPPYSSDIFDRAEHDKIPSPPCRKSSIKR